MCINVQSNFLTYCSLQLIRFKTNGCILKKIMLLHFVQLKLDETIVYSFSELNVYVIHV